MFGARKVCHFRQKNPRFGASVPQRIMAYASVYHLSPEFCPTIWNSYVLPAFGNYGLPSALLSVARFLLSSGASPLSAKAVFTTSETTY